MRRILQHKAIVIATILAMAVGVGVWWFVNLGGSGASCSVEDMREECLLSPDAVDEGVDSQIQLADLRVRVARYIEREGLSDKLSLYYMDLQTGRRITHRGGVQSLAASLMKLPLAMDAYAAIEDGYIKATDRMTLTEQYLDETYTTFSESDIGKSYSVEDLIRIMLVDSDNTAMLMLGERFDNNRVYGQRSVLQELDIQYSLNETADNILIGPREYASFLSCLYKACYITPEHSAAALAYLQQSALAGPIRETVPEDIRVAHKFGVYAGEAFNDCAVVYEPNRPFVLCIMTSMNEATSSPHIRQLTKLIYEYVRDVHRS